MEDKIAQPNCPKCNAVMEPKPEKTRETVSATGTRYDHTVYHCPADDIWTSIEIPRE